MDEADLKNFATTPFRFDASGPEASLVCTYPGRRPRRWIARSVAVLTGAAYLATAFYDPRWLQATTLFEFIPFVFASLFSLDLAGRRGIRRVERQVTFAPPNETPGYRSPDHADVSIDGKRIGAVARVGAVRWHSYSYWSRRSSERFEVAIATAHHVYVMRCYAPEDGARAVAQQIAEAIGGGTQAKNNSMKDNDSLYGEYNDVFCTFLTILAVLTPVFTSNSHFAPYRMTLFAVAILGSVVCHRVVRMARIAAEAKEFLREAYGVPDAEVRAPVIPVRYATRLSLAVFLAMALSILAPGGPRIVIVKRAPVTQPQ